MLFATEFLSDSCNNHARQGSADLTVHYPFLEAISEELKDALKVCLATDLSLVIRALESFI